MKKEEQTRNLESEIENVRKDIKTDNYSISVRELVQIYRDGDLELFPSYQRIFRWDDNKKTRFIESLLMGMPTPPLFIAQRRNSTWIIVDGLQRVCTILQTMGLLKKSKTDDELMVPLQFTWTESLPSLENLIWEDLTDDVQRMIKMSKIDLKIILIENTPEAQYELFKRLNTGAVVLEAQEIRNCIIVMLDEQFLQFLEELKVYPNYLDAISISDNKKKVEFHMELILRYLINNNDDVDFKRYNHSTDLLADFIDKETVNLINVEEFGYDKTKKEFEKIFDLLYDVLGVNSFKKYNKNKACFEGSFSQSSFEAILPGLSANIDYYITVEGKAKLETVIKNMYEQADFIKYSNSGVKALTRISNLIEFSKSYFLEYVEKA